MILIIALGILLGYLFIVLVNIFIKRPDLLLNTLHFIFYMPAAFIFKLLNKTHLFLIHLCKNILKLIIEMHLMLRWWVNVIYIICIAISVVIATFAFVKDFNPITSLNMIIYYTPIFAYFNLFYYFLGVKR